MKKSLTILSGKLFLIFAFIACAAGVSSAQTYCNSSFSSVTYEYINNVTFAGINNSTSGTTGGPVNYLSLGPANVTIGTPSNISVSIQVDGNEYIYAFIDWDHNGILNNTGEVYIVGNNVSTAGPFVLAITPPPTALTGTTRMRVMLDWNNAVPDPCRVATYGEAEDYTVNVSAATGCSTATFPASAGTTATPGTICLTGNVTLGITPVTPIPAASGITYQWQKAAAAAGPWSNIGTPTVAPTFTTSISATSYFRCLVLCSSTTVLTSAASPAVTVTDPGSPTVTPGSRCGPGTVNLAASTSAPSGSIRWYSSATSTFPLATGNTYATPYLPATTTYYAAAVTNATQQTYTAGLPAFIQNNPFISSTAGWGLRFTVTGTCNIDSVGVYPVGTGTLSIRIWDAVSQAVIYTSPVSPTMTGTGNEKKMIYVGALNLPPGNYVLGIGSFTGLSALHNEGFNASAYPFTCPVLSITAGSQGFGGAGTAYVYYFSYDWRVSALGGCEGPRLPVAATINASPVVPKAAPAVVCNDAPATIVLTPPTPAYATYAWTPIAGLYTDAATTTPYTGGSATTLYMRTSNVGQQTYYMMAGNPAVATGCTFADTLKIWSQPGTASIVAHPDSVCIAGPSALSLSPLTGYAPNSIQWQESADGVTYNNVTGATSPSYTTPSLTTGHYYRALVKSTSDTCLTLDKHIVVVNPVLLSASDSFNCGPGTVTLHAETGGNSTAKWYETPTGGSVVGVGSPWETPYLGLSKTYYVAAEGGSEGGAPVTIQVGNGTSSYGGANSSVGPFSVYYRRYTMQFLYKASEILAAGGNPGNMTSIAFNCTGLPLYAIPNFTVSIKFVPSSMNVLTWQTGLTQVYTTASLLPSATGWVTFPFNNNQLWNGTDNVVIEVCRSQVQPDWNSSGNHQYFTATGRFLSSNLDDPGSSCGVVGASTSTYLPNVRFGMQEPCQTPRLAVNAYIRPEPVVDLGQDINKCIDAGSAEVLDAGVQPDNPTFLWDNLSTSQVRAITTTGTYYVKVTNQYTCKGYDTINVVLRKNPSVSLGNDTTVCNGVVLNINAGGAGIEYFWNTGATTQTINVSSPGSYSVFVTNAVGCSKADTILVNMQGQLPTINGINISNDGQYTFHFTAIDPQNVIGYEWDFGDNTTHSYAASATHLYAGPGNYVVTLKLSSSCGFMNDTASAHIVGISQNNIGADGLTLYPNPSSGTATISGSAGLKMERIALYNMLGQMVYSEKAQRADKHVLSLDALASGVYNVQIFTDKGSVTRKLEIVK